MLLLPSIIVVLWSMLTVGTKVSFGAAVITLALASFIALLHPIWYKKYAFNFSILTLLGLANIFVVPETPTGKNLDLTVTNMNASQDKTEDAVSSSLDNDFFVILSGRNDFLREVKLQFQGAPMYQKIFGMGHGGNYEEKPKLIEMDFFDWFFSFGIVGFPLLLSPLIFVAYYIIKNLLQVRLRNLFSINLLVVSSSVCLGLGTAFVAGHVLTAPASSIYLAIFVSYLFVLSSQYTEE